MSDVQTSSLVFSRFPFSKVMLILETAAAFSPALAERKI